MRVSKELAERLVKARIDRNVARRAVVDWMREEGRAGHLRCNRDAPGWDAYKAAEIEWTKALNRFDMEIL